MLFELDAENELATVSRPTLTDLSCSTLAQIAQTVASTGQLFNIDKMTEWLRAHPDIHVEADEDVTTCAGGSNVHSILCMPIVNGQNKVIGVVQLINKVILNLKTYRYFIVVCFVSIFIDYFYFQYKTD